MAAKDEPAVIVIGSGVSGLVCANLLARDGRRVVVCERHGAFGGYMQQFAVEGTTFDVGCHYVGGAAPGQVLDRYLRCLGVREELDLVPMDPEGFDVVVGPALRFAVPQGHEAFAARLAGQYPGQADAVRAFVGQIAAEAARFPMYALDDQGDDPRGDPGPPRTVEHVLRECGVTHPDVRDVLLAHGLLYFVPPHECPFQLHAFVVDSLLRGASTIAGGGGALTRALLRKLRSLGGEARRRTGMAAIEVSDGAVTGVRTDEGERLPASVVIAAVHPKVVLRLLPEGAGRRSWTKRLARMRDGLGSLGCYLRVGVDLGAHAGRNYLCLGDRGMASLFDQSWADTGAAPPAFVTVPRAREPGRKGPEPVVAFTGLGAGRFDVWQDTLTGRRPEAYRREKEALGARLLAQVYRVVPEAEGATLTTVFSSPLTNRDYTGSAGGAPYGLHHSVDQTGLWGVSSRTGVRGLLLCGQSVLYPGILGATISAFYACGELLGLPRLHRRLCGVSAP